MSHDVPAYGLWGLVLINSAVFIMFAYSFAPPRTAIDPAGRPKSMRAPRYTGDTNMKVPRIPTGVGLVPLALALAVLAAGCATTPTAAGLPLAQRVETARTPAEHLALANDYEQLAAQARERAASHRAALAVYQHGAQYQWIDPVGVSLTMPRHCEQLIQSEDDLARSYAAMAQEHRRLARPETNSN